MKNLTLLLLTASIAAPALACPTIYAPVCADSKKATQPAEIFGNTCQAQAAGFVPRKGGANIRFDINNEVFTVYTTSKKAIAEAKYLLRTGKTKVPVMTLVDGASCSQPWTFHAQADNMEFADQTIELCDGVPSYIEANKEEWLEKVKIFCPWSAKVTEVNEQ